jgi:bifunctional non-homologous end joining protein LigD
VRAHRGLTVPASKLSTYRAKRDFKKTGEPSGSKAVAKSGRLRFVIQKHAARRLHYDLRLELDGVFKSWAVTRGPSLDPADKRLAVEVEDHPLDYGDFEGTIPQGQYGGGTVQLWDRGYWEPTPGWVPAAALTAGELKFSLDGQRLHGSWVLVRLRRDRSGSKRTNWLLIKHRDAAALDSAAANAVLEEDRSVASGRSMARIAAGQGKGPKPFMLSTRREAKPDAVWQSKQTPAAPISKPATRGRARAPMPSFIEPQLCTLVEQPPETQEWVHEIKLDGYRLQLRVERHKAVLRTRTGLDWTDKFPQIARAAAALADCIIDGEVVALDSARVPSFADLQAALSDGNTARLTFFAFDLLFLDGADLRALPLLERKQRLNTLLEELSSTPIRYLQHFEASGASVLASATRMSLEGIVSKRAGAPYVSGRAGGWTKAKSRAGHEVIIGGYTLRAGYPRSLLVGVHNGRQLVYVGRVGTGFAQSTIEKLLPRFNAVASERSPFSGEAAPAAEKNVRWLRPELVAEIEFAGWTDSGMVRQAAFKGLREDKPANEVRAERPSKLQRADMPDLTDAKSAPKKATRARKTVAPTAEGILGVKLSQPGKILWPDAGDGHGVSKLDLARYFEAVGEWMIGHIAGRPCSLVRAPDGIGGQRFFQRHAMAGQSSLFKMMTVSGDRKPYLAIDRVDALIAAAQSAALELHPWNCAPNAPDVPGRLVFDLDPAPDVDFDAVIAAAIELRQRLEALGLASFCKTTGGKGLHVVTPLLGQRDRLDWAAAKTFSQAVCAQMAEDSPRRYLTTMAKKDRGGRIFLDYLRNDRMATAVAPLSPRARAGATVSMPLHWREVRAGLAPAAFTVRTAPALLARRHPWDDYQRASKQSLRAAVTRLTEPARRGRSNQAAAQR